MKKILVVFILLLFPIISFADEIFIPVELWLGENITGSEKIIFPEVNFKFGYKERHKIKGPIIWENSKTNQNIKVYVRSRYSKKEDKEISQLWTITITINVWEEFLIIGVIDLQKMGVSFQQDFGSKEKAGHLRQITLMKEKETIKELKLLLS